MTGQARVNYMAGADYMAVEKKKIYIAGSGGMLGEAFYKIFSSDYELKCTDIDLNADWLSYLDFRDIDAYTADVLAFKPDYLFHVGAYTDLEYCENNVDDTYMTNTLSVENAVYISNKLNIPLLYISTAGIFDGKKEEYDDWDIPYPLGHYARSKYAGELFVEKNSTRYLICRAGWMMGAGPSKDKKFINKIMAKLKSGEKELFIENKLGTPTYTYDFARCVKGLLEKEYWGLYNMVCSGATGRYEVAQELVKIHGLENDVKITLVGADYWAKEYFAARPDCERLVDKKLKLRGMNFMRHWKVCLKEYMQTHYANYLE